MNIVTFETEQSYLEASLQLATQIAGENGGLKMGLCGGSTPQKFYEKLPHYIDMQASSFYQIDERYVPADDKDSNQHMIRNTLLQNHPEADFFNFETNLPLVECVQNFEEKISHLTTNPLDLCIVGVGDDGHIASLFPHSPALDNKNNLAVHTQTDSFAVTDRLSVTYSVIENSKHILILLKGAAKAGVVSKLQQQGLDFHTFPVAKLAQHSSLTIHFWKEG